MCTHISKCKNDTVEATPGEKERGRIGRGDERMVEEVNSCMIYLIHCKNLYKCHNVPPPGTTIKGKNSRNLRDIKKIICKELLCRFRKLTKISRSNSYAYIQISKYISYFNSYHI
jgi:hypothetical protein